mmetsp:Transcript_12079/g.44087  ORF Transcript_12079/g.44087 Transcript_12079/m.44087 type:complete len:1245 (+) Transcript_12079:241-3975(+)
MAEVRADKVADAMEVDPATEQESGKQVTKKAVHKKTEAQKNALEAAYIANQYPDERIRASIAKSIGLNESQVNVWFCHRRRKDRSTQEAKEKPRQPSAGEGQANGKKSSEGTPKRGRGGRVSRGGGRGARSGGRGSKMSTPTKVKDKLTPLEALLADDDGTEWADLASFLSKETEGYKAACVYLEKAGTELPTEGCPVLGMLFDKPRLIDFDAHGLDANMRRDARQLLQMSMKKKGSKTTAARPLYAVPGKKRSTNAEQLLKQKRMDDAKEERRRRLEQEKLLKLKQDQSKRKRREEELLARKRRKLEELQKKEKEAEERRLQREEERRSKLEAKEKEKNEKLQERLAQKAEREREREAQKLEREKQREAQREEQRKLKAELRLKQIKPVLPPDEEIELTELGQAEQMTLDEAFDRKDELYKKKPFPPVLQGELELCKAVPAEFRGEVFMIWNMLGSFASKFDLWPFSVEELAKALLNPRSRLIGEIHCALLKRLITDMEEAHAQVSAGPLSMGTQGASAIQARAKILDEGVEWGFEPVEWSSSLNGLTWPEVLRQYALSASWGPQRVEGGDEEDEDGEKPVLFNVEGVAGSFIEGSVKGACVKVLKEAGPEGMTVSEITAQIDDAGLRNPSSKTPESSVAGALARDIVFTRIAPARYALRINASKVKAERRVEEGPDPNQSSDAKNVENPEKDDAANKIDVGTKVEAETNGALAETGLQDMEVEETRKETQGGAPGDAALQAAVPAADEDIAVVKEEPSAAEEGEEEEDDAGFGPEAWVQYLETLEYPELSLPCRVNILVTLADAVLESTYMRAVVDERLEQLASIRRQLTSENRLKKQTAKDLASLKAHKKETDKEIGNGEAEADATEGQNNGDENNTSADEKAALLKVAAEREEYLTQEQAKRAVRISSLKRCAEENWVRWQAVGMDRRYTRYFLVRQGIMEGVSTSLVIETDEGRCWRCIGTRESVELLTGLLDVRGAREAALLDSLKKILPLFDSESKNGHANGSTSPIKTECGGREHLRAEFKEWLVAARTRASRIMEGQADVSDTDEEFGRVSVSAEMLRLKIVLSDLESAVPEEAVTEDFNKERSHWLDILTNSTKPGQLLWCVLKLEACIKPEWLSKDFLYSPLSEVEVDALLHADDAESDAVPIWLPLTTSAVSLRIFHLDTHVLYTFTQSQKKTQRKPKTGVASKDDLKAIAGNKKQKKPASNITFPSYPSELAGSDCEEFELPLEQFRRHIK